MDLNEFKSEARCKVLLYGPPKAGKTLLAGKLAEAGFRLWWFDLENGIKTLLGAQGISTEARSRVNYFRIPDHKLSPVAIDTMKAIFRTATPKKICFDHGVVNCAICAKDANAKFTTFDFSGFTDKDIIVVDSLTQLAQSAIFRKVLPHIKGDKGDDYKFEWDDYTAQTNALTEVLSKMQVLPVNCIFISHEIDTEKDEKKEKIAPQAGTRNYSKLVGKYFDEVIYAYVLNGKHKIATETTFSNTVTSGGRSGKQLMDKDGKMDLAPLFQD